MLWHVRKCFEIIMSFWLFQIFNTMPQGLFYGGHILHWQISVLTPTQVKEGTDQEHYSQISCPWRLASLQTCSGSSLLPNPSQSIDGSKQRELHCDSLQLWSLPNCCLIDQVLSETLWSKKIKKSTRVLAKMALNVRSSKKSTSVKPKKHEKARPLSSPASCTLQKNEAWSGRWHRSPIFR